MRIQATALALLASLLLAGCSFGGEGESSDVDKREYGGGSGIAVALTNDAKDAFDVVVTIVGVGGSEVARVNETIQPGRSLERWFTVDGRSAYSVRMSYQWHTETRTSSGSDEETIVASDCPSVTRLAWSFQQGTDMVGSRFDGRTCVSEEGAEANET